MSALDHTVPDRELQMALQRLYPTAGTDGVSIDVWKRVESGDLGTPGAGSEWVIFSGARLAT